jgi:hypothetical protein
MLDTIRGFCLERLAEASKAALERELRKSDAGVVQQAEGGGSTVASATSAVIRCASASVTGAAPVHLASSSATGGAGSGRPARCREADGTSRLSQAAGSCRA